MYQYIAKVLPTIFGNYTGFFVISSKFRAQSSEFKAQSSKLKVQSSKLKVFKNHFTNFSVYKMLSCCLNKSLLSLFG